MTFPSISPLYPLQEAIYDELREDDDLMDLVTLVAEDIPEGQAKPYVRIGEFLSTPDNAHDSFGRNVTCTFHTWTNQNSNAPGLLITERIQEILDHVLIPIDGHRMVSMRLEFDQTLRDPDPAIRHHVQRFRILTSQEDDEGS